MLKGCCAAVFVIASVRSPRATARILTRDINDPLPQVRVNAIMRIQVMMMMIMMMMNLL